ncbi:cysteine--tRNA ligase [uncultured Pseudokineococcus sp.]|uniref:cysteine--tRNA ligase n=1 Tax=uncultured Pseudokineococcus sp. TaxID=1642928 RepID=UPI002610A494|nr:cysteine--tRNA ligase [uncultured Pseudokineococcus sp.]
MSLRLHDTASGELRELSPLVPGEVSVYLCGATVQAPPHIGHVRSGIAFDVLARWLEAGHGLRVVFIRNVTDVDDKILDKSAAAGVPWWAWASRHEQAFTRAYDALGVRRPTYEPRATGHVTEMLEMVDEIVAAGHAYPAPDGSGDVYFDVRSWPDYGSLTHQSLADMEPAADADPRGKRDPRDFALWKGAKEGEAASWPSRWGRGRPGWHLECSAMARRYLGRAFDVHAGGLDLRFPHHENEQAQSRAAGDAFATTWLHNGWVTVGGEKMSKSLGNSLVVDAVLASGARPLALRYALGTAHYRSMIEYSPEHLVEAGRALERVEGFLRRARQAPGAADAAFTMEFPAAFRTALDDDLNVPAAVAVVHETVRAGNTALDAGDGAAAQAAAQRVVAMLDVLGLNPLDPQWDAAAGASGRAEQALDQLVAAELVRRQAAREQRDFATADGVRDRLAGLGIAVEDTPDGARWSWAEDA